MCVVFAVCRVLGSILGTTEYTRERSEMQRSSAGVQVKPWARCKSQSLSDADGPDPNRILWRGCSAAGRKLQSNGPNPQRRQLTSHINNSSQEATLQWRDAYLQTRILSPGSVSHLLLCWLHSQTDFPSEVAGWQPGIPGYILPRAGPGVQVEGPGAILKVNT